MNEESYLSDRVENQIAWYDDKSQLAQRRFKLLRGFEVIAAATIPLVAGFGKEPFPVSLFVGVLGTSIAIASTIISLNQYQENWTEYRTTCESLKHEKFLFLTKAEPYDKEEPFLLFVQRVEGLISKENSSWSKYTQVNLQKTNAINENQS